MAGTGLPALALNTPALPGGGGWTTHPNGHQPNHQTAPCLPACLPCLPACPARPPARLPACPARLPAGSLRSWVSRVQWGACWLWRSLGS